MTTELQITEVCGCKDKVEEMLNVWSCSILEFKNVCLKFSDYLRLLTAQGSSMSLACLRWKNHRRSHVKINSQDCKIWGELQLFFHWRQVKILYEIFLHLIKFCEGFTLYIFLLHLSLFIIILSKFLILNWTNYLISIFILLVIVAYSSRTHSPNSTCLNWC